MQVWKGEYVEGTKAMHFRRTFGCAIPMIHKETSITQSLTTSLILRRTKQISHK